MWKFERELECPTCGDRTKHAVRGQAGKPTLLWCQRCRVPRCECPLNGSCDCQCAGECARAASRDRNTA